MGKTPSDTHQQEAGSREREREVHRLVCVLTMDVKKTLFRFVLFVCIIENVCVVLDTNNLFSALFLFRN